MRCTMFKLNSFYISDSVSFSIVTFFTSFYYLLIPFFLLNRGFLPLPTKVRFKVLLKLLTI